MTQWLNTRPASYWQRGCNDGRSRKPRQWPEPHQRPSSPANESYDNGYTFGRRQQFLEDQVAAKLAAAGVNPSDGGRR